MRYERIITICIALSVSVPFMLIKARPSAKLEDVAGFSLLTGDNGYLHVYGDVRHPGIYVIPANKMTLAAINMAEPLQSVKSVLPAGVDSVSLKSGTSIYLRFDPDGHGNIRFGQMSSAERILMAIPLDINSMRESDFRRLPGIGEVMSRRIVEYRQNNGGKMAVEELLNVYGIGEKKYFKLKKYF